MTSEPIVLTEALSRFDALWSPRILARVNDYDVRVAKVRGEHVWHAHDDTDELFLVLDGELTIALQEPAGEREVRLPTGSVFVVPRGVQHRPSSPDGASILLLEPTGTVSTGDATGVPDTVDTTTGHLLD
jgi:mannose-6-phosphate isomerase-like protein (cupin superfamily)